MKPKNLAGDTDDLSLLLEDELQGWCEPQLEAKMEEVSLDWSRPLTMVELETQMQQCREEQRRQIREKKARLAASAEAALISVELQLKAQRDRSRVAAHYGPKARITPVVMELAHPLSENESLIAKIRTDQDVFALTSSMQPRRQRRPRPGPRHYVDIRSSSPIVRMRTVPPAVMLEIDKNKLPQVHDSSRRGPDLDDADLYAQQTHYSNNLPARVKKGLSYHDGTHTLCRFEREHVQNALSHKSKTRRHMELKQLEQSLRIRETRKIDIERQMRMARSITSLCDPSLPLGPHDERSTNPSISSMTLLYPPGINTIRSPNSIPRSISTPGLDSRTGRGTNRKSE